MKVTDLTEVKAKKKGEITVKGVIDDLINGYENNEIQSIICVILNKNDDILMSCTDMKGTEGIGMLECGKQNIINDMYK